MTTDSLDRSWTTTADAAESRVGEEIVILHLKSGIYFGLDAVGVRVWSGIQSGRSLRDICNDIAGEFDEDVERVRGDVRAFMTLLSEQALIEPA